MHAFLPAISPPSFISHPGPSFRIACSSDGLAGVQYLEVSELTDGRVDGGKAVVAQQQLSQAGEAAKLQRHGPAELVGG